MNKVWVWPRAYFHEQLAMMRITDETVYKASEYAFISIQSSQAFGKNEFPYFKKQHPNALTIVFDDITDKDVSVMTLYPDCHLFTDEDADKIVDFVKKNLNKKFIVHCTAGISRSGAVGEFIQRVLMVPYDDFKKENPNIGPNIYVLSKLMQAWDRAIDKADNV